MSFSSFSSQYVMLISPYIAGRDRQVLLGLLAFTRPPVEPAEADVTVGRERAHLELGGHSHGGAVACRGRRHIRGLMMRGDVAEEAKSPRLIAAFTAPASEAHGAVGAGPGVLELVREQRRLAELSDAERVVIPNPCGFIGGQRLLQTGDAFLNASRPRVHVPQSSRCDRSVTRDVPR